MKKNSENVSEICICREQK